MKIDIANFSSGQTTYIIRIFIDIVWFFVALSLQTKPKEVDRHLSFIQERECCLDANKCQPRQPTVEVHIVWRCWAWLENFVEYMTLLWSCTLFLLLWRCFWMPCFDFSLTFERTSNTFCKIYKKIDWIKGHGVR